MEWWNLEGVRTAGRPPEVIGLTHDSRLVRPGVAFVAVPGKRGDGHYFLAAGLAAGARLSASRMTTLEAPAIQEAMADAVVNGTRGIVVEASSEGLAQHRLEGCEFDVAVFTNLTRDHLDFHGTMEAYRAAKGRLFEMVGEAAAKPFTRAAV